MVIIIAKFILYFSFKKLEVFLVYAAFFFTLQKEYFQKDADPSGGHREIVSLPFSARLCKKNIYLSGA